MRHLANRLSFRLLGGSVLAIALAFAACSDADNPAAPSVQRPAESVQTLTITAGGVFPGLAYIRPNAPLMIINNDTRPHQLHLDVEDQPGCGGLDLAGEIPPGESRMTGPISGDAVACDAHDHQSHGDKRYSFQLVLER
jgi:hypothetical protein